MERDLSLLLPDIALLLTAVAALIAEMFHREKVVFRISISGLILAFFLTLPQLSADTTVFSGTFRVDSLSGFAKVILVPATLLILLLTQYELGKTKRAGSVYTLLLFTTLGSLVLAGAGDMMFLILGMLIASLASYALVLYPQTEKSTEAGMKYFIFGSISTALMLFGLTYWYGLSGSTLLSDLPTIENMQILGLVGTIGVLAGLGYKASLVPFHFWTPDAYEGGPVSIAAYLSVIPKIGSIFALMQIAKNIPAGVDWTLIISLIAIATMTFGNVAALLQKNVVRLFAYSSITQSGYLLFAVAMYGKSMLSLSSLLVFASAYAVMNIGAFAVISQFGPKLSSYDGLSKNHPWLAAAMTVFLFSLVGIPPLFGFVGKIMLFGAAIEGGALPLAVFGIINTVVSLGVYARIISPMYWGEKKIGKQLSPQLTFVWSVCFGITLIFGVISTAFLAQFYS